MDNDDLTSRSLLKIQSSSLRKLWDIVGGKHWCAIFIDTRKPADTDITIEFFDPTGDPPKKPVMEWQAEMKEALEKYRQAKGHTGGVQTVVSTTAHQQENNECGVAKR